MERRRSGVALVLIVLALSILPSIAPQSEQNLLVTTDTTGYQVLGTYRAPIEFGRPVTWLAEIQDSSGALRYVSYTTPAIELTSETLEYDENVSLSIVRYTLSAPIPYENLTVPVPYADLPDDRILSDIPYERNATHLIFTIDTLEDNATIDLLTRYDSGQRARRLSATSASGPIIIQAGHEALRGLRVDGRTLTIDSDATSSITIQLPESLPENHTVYLQDDGRLIPLEGDPAAGIFRARNVSGNTTMRVVLPERQGEIHMLDPGAVRVERADRNTTMRTDATITSFSLVDPNTVPDAPARFERGLYRFEATNLTNGRVDIVFDDVPEDPIIWKYSAAQNRWYRYPFVRLNESAIKATIYDGGLGDEDGLVNGVIIDDIGVSTDWWNATWSYRSEVNVTSSQSSNVSDYELRIPLNSSVVGTDFNWTEDEQALRTIYYNASSSAETSIPYWIEYWNASAEIAVVWADLPLLPASSTDLGLGAGKSVVYLYYGNPAATNESNGTAVFDYYAEFEGANDFTNGSATTSYVTGINGQAIEVDGGTSYQGVWRDATSGRDVAFDADVRIPSGNPTSALGGIYYGATATEPNAYQAIVDERGSQGDVCLREDYGFGDDVCGSESGTISTNTWYDLTAIWESDGTRTIEVRTRNQSLFDSATTSDTTYTDGGYGIAAYDAIQVDRYRIRTYVDPAPSLAYAGQQELAVLSAAITAPANDTNVSRYTAFTFNASLDCENGSCGNVSAYAQYLGTQTPLQAFFESSQADFSNSTSSTNLSIGGTISLNATTQPWWDAAWPYRLNLTITSGSAETDYAVPITLNSSIVGTNFNWTSDRDAIRFVEYGAGYTELDYYVDSWNASAENATVYVQVPSLSAGTNDIELYYGNDAASDASDGDATFEYFVDFNDYTIQSAFGSQDEFPSQWSKNETSLNMWGNNWKGIALTHTSDGDGSQVLEFYAQDTLSTEISAVGSDSSLVSGPTASQLYQFAGSQSYGISPDTTYTSGRELVQAVLDDYTGTFDYLIFANDDDETGKDGNVTFSQVRIRPYTATEPNVTGWTSEEALSVEPSGTYVSEVFDTNGSSTFDTISWTSTVPAGTSLTVRTRTSDGSGQTWWNESFPYRIPISLSGSGQEEYQVLVELNLTAQEAASKLQSDCDDVRFTWMNGSNEEELPHAQQVCAFGSENASFWVQVPQISSETINLYYGNSTVASSENRTATFDYSEPRIFAYVVSDTMATDGIVVTALENDTTVSAGGSNYSLDAYNSTTISGLSRSDSIAADKHVNVEGAGDYNDMLAPISWASTHFIGTGMRDTDRWCFLSPYGSSNVTLDDGVSNVYSGTVNESGTCTVADVTEGSNAIIDADLPILVWHETSIGGPGDGYVLYPPTSRALYGPAVSTTLLVGSNDTTNVTCLGSDAASGSFTTNASTHGDCATIITPADDGATPSVRVTSNGSVAAIQQADSDGRESTVLLPRIEFSERFVTDFDVQYVASVSEASGVTCEVRDPSLLSTNVSVGSGPAQGCFNCGTDALWQSGPLSLTCDEPIWAYYERNSPDTDETMMFGEVQTRQGSQTEPTVTPSVEENVTYVQSNPSSFAWSSWFVETNGAAISSPDARYIQYDLSLSTTDTSKTPEFDDVTIGYRVLSDEWIDLLSSGTDLTTTNPQECGVINETSSNCTVSFSIVGQQEGEYDVRVEARSTNFGVYPTSTPITITVLIQPSFTSFTASPNTRVANETTTLTATIVDDLANPLQDATIDFYDLTGNGSMVYVGNATTDASGDATIDYTLPSDSLTGTHTLLANYSGSSDVFLNATNTTTTMLVTSEPVIENLSATPSTVGFGTNVTITANVSDAVGLDSVRVNVTGPNSTTLADMTPATGSGYEFTVGEKWLTGVFNVTVIANNTDGREIVSSPISFSVDVDLDFRVGTEKDSYQSNEFVYVNGTVDTTAYPDWRFRVPIVIEPDATLSNATIRVSFNDSEINFSHPESDGSDFRLTKLESGGGETILPIYVNEFNTSNGQGSVYTRGDFDTSGETIYLYYGNSAASSSSNGSDVFYYYEDFEDMSDWTNYSSGTVVRDTARVYRGNYTAFKDGNNDPNGATALLPVNISRGYQMEFWVNRDSGWSGGGQDRVGFIDESGNGYGWAFDHTNDFMRMDTRTTYTGGQSQSVAAVDVMDEWVFGRFSIPETGSIRAERYVDGLLEDETQLNDFTYSNFSRVYIFGGQNYWVDEMRVYPYTESPTVTIGIEERLETGITNQAAANTSAYLRMLVQRWTGSSWQNLIPPVIDQQYFTIDDGAFPTNFYNLTDEWLTAGAWDTSTEPAGLYRVYAVLEDENRTTLTDTEGTALIATSNFSILEAGLVVTNLTHENEEAGYNEYETGDTIDYVNVTVSALNNTAYDALVRLSVLNGTAESTPWGPQNESYDCATISLGGTCLASYTNTSSGYAIPTDVAQGLYVFRWNVWLNASNGPTRTNDTTNFMIHNVPYETSAATNVTRLFRPGSVSYEVNVTNPWSAAITGVTASINCESATGVTCASTSTGQLNETVASIASSATQTFTFEFNATNSTPSANYNVSFNLTYTNPRGDSKSWSELRERSIEVRYKGILEIIDVSHPNTVTRGSSYNLSAYYNNTGDVQANDTWLNYTLPSGWSVTSGTQDRYDATLPALSFEYNNITVLIGSSAPLGSQLVRLDSAAIDGREDFISYTIDVYGPTNTTLTTNASTVDRNRTVELSATLEYANGTAISGRTITFSDETEGGFLANATTNGAGIATYDYTIPPSATLGSHTLNASYAGSGFALPSYGETTITVTRPPVVENASATPSTTGYGQEVTISADVTDDGTVDSATATITYPDSSTSELAMTNVSSTYTTTFSDTWQSGQYNVSIRANDTLGSEATNTTSFTIDAGLLAKAATNRSSYNQNENVTLQGPVAWWNSEWTYRTNVTATNALGGAQTNVTLRFEVPTGDLIDAGKLENDCADLRFATTQQLDYWTEGSCSTSANTTYYVRVPNLPSAGITLAYYYGNSDASDATSRDDTFVFYDDFESFSGWVTQGSGNLVADTARAYAGSQSAHKIDNDDPNGAYKSLGTSLGRNVVLEAWVNRNGSSTGGDADRIGLVDGSGNGYGWIYNHGSGLGVDERSSYTGTPSAYVDTYGDVVDEWIFARLIIETNDIISERYVNGSLEETQTITDTTVNSWNNAYVFGGNDYWVDEMRVYKDAQSTYTYGSEEHEGSLISSLNGYNHSGYVTLRIETNTSGSWQPVATILNDTDTSMLRNWTNTGLDLEALFTSWNTTTSTGGTYRVVAEAYGPSSILADESGNDVRGYGYFTIEQPEVLLILDDLRVYDVTDTSPANRRIYTNDQVGSGLNDTYVLETNRIYRFEVDVRNDGNTTWSINDSTIEHRNVPATYNVSDVWFSNQTLLSNRRSDATETGIFNGTVMWNMSTTKTVSASSEASFFYLVNTSSTADQQVVFSLENTVSDLEDRSTIQVLDVDNEPPKLYNDVYNVTPLEIFRGGSFTAYARWNETIGEANVTYDTTGAFAFNTVTNSSPQNPQNWTNFTITSSSAWYRGNHSVRIDVEDLSGNVNDTLADLTFSVYGRSRIGTISLNASSIGIGETVRISCRIVDNTASNAPISGYTVSFTNGTATLGTNTTAGSGYAYWDYTDNTAGDESVGCFIQDDLANFYKTGTPNSSTLTLSTTEPEPPQYGAINGSSSAYKGAFVDLDVYWTDNFALDEAELSTNVSGSYSNVTTQGLSGTGEWANFSYQLPTSMTPGPMGWRQWGLDTSTNSNVTPIQTITVYGWSEIDGFDVSPGSISLSSSTTATCSVRDANSSAALAGYTVQFDWKNDTDLSYTSLGSNTTDGSGDATYSWTPSLTGIYDVRCSISDDLSVYYNVSLNESTDSLSVVSGADTQPPRLIAPGTYTINDTVVFRGQCALVTGEWDESINYSTLRYNRTSSTFETHVGTPPYTGNWTNISLCTNSTWTLGDYNVQLRARDQAGNLNDTLELKDLQVRGRSNVTYVSPSATLNRTTHTVTCRVMDEDTGTPLNGYPVTFYDSDLGFSIGSDNTNSSGYASVNYDFSGFDVGPDQLSCTISNEGFYTAQSPTTASASVEWRGYLNTTIDAPPNATTYARGSTVTFNSTTLDEFGAFPDDSSGNPATLTAQWRNSSGSVLVSGEDIEWTIPATYPLGETIITLNVTEPYYESDMDQITLTITGGTNVTYVAPTGNVSATVDLTCRVIDSITGSGISSYDVDFYRAGTSLGTSATNSTGYATLAQDTTLLADGDYTFRCEISDDPPTYTAQDTESNETVTVDNTDPVVNYAASADASGNYSRTWIFVNATASDTHLDTVTLDWNGTNETLSQEASGAYSVNKSGLSDGTYTARVYANDSAGNTVSTVQRTYTIDTSAPNLSIQSPTNTTYNVADVDLNFTVSDANLDSCSYDLNGTGVTPLPGCSNTTLSSLADGFYELVVYANDTLGNTASASVNFTVQAGVDVLIEDLVFVPSSGAIEGQTVDVRVNVSNNGTSSAQNLLVELNVSLWNGSWVPVASNTSVVNVSAGSWVQANFTWTADLGLYRFEAFVDSNASFSESNESNNQVSENYSVSSYQVEYGLVNFSKFLSNSALDQYKDWTVDTPSGVIYYADADASYFPFNLEALNGTNDLDEADTALGMTYFDDSISDRWDSDDNGVPDTFESFTISGAVIENVPVVASTPGSPFVTGIMWDSSDGGSEYNGSQDLVFVTRINASTLGTYGTYDYEISLPSRLKTLLSGTDLVERFTEIE